MIDLYGMGSPNVLKIAIMLEEIAQPYTPRHVRVLHNANFEPEFLALNPLGKVPVIVDHGGAGSDQPIFESGAILIYLAETYQQSLLPVSGSARWEILKWLMVQVAYAGPMLGQLNHFQLVPSEADSYAAHRYKDQASRIYRQLDDRLKVVRWLGGDDYSIADIAMYPWAAFVTRHGFDAGDYPNLTAWREHIDGRSAVKRAVEVVNAMIAADPLAVEPVTNEHFDRFFGRSDPGPAADLARYLALGPITTAQL